MKIHREEIRLRTTAETDILDLTGQVEEAVTASGIAEGMVLVFAPGSTAAITTLEFESGCVADLERAVERLAPRGEEYAHDARWGDGNGYSHVRAALIGPSLSLPVHDGRVDHGTWQQIVLCDFDNKPGRERRVLVDVFGH